MDNLIMFFKIIDNLYLGDEETSKNLEQLKSLNITHILRIGTGLDIIKFPNFTYMVVDSTDSNDDKLLFKFDSVYEFIDSALTKGKILVYCKDSKDLSPTIIIAFLIKSRKLTYEAAFELVKEINTNIVIKENHIDELRELDSLTNIKNEFSYHCILCRKKLFEDIDIDSKHSFLPKGQYSYKRYKKSFVKTTECTSYFLTNFIGLDLLEVNDVRISCPTKNCKNKLGDFSPKGTQCSCGSWVVPAIQIPKSKVDKVKLNK